LRLKIFKQLRTASPNSEFSGAYKKKGAYKSCWILGKALTWCLPTEVAGGRLFIQVADGSFTRKSVKVPFCRLLAGQLWQLNEKLHGNWNPWDPYLNFMHLSLSSVSSSASGVAKEGVGGASAHFLHLF